MVFICAVLGELDFRDPQNFFLHNPQDQDLTTNSLLQVTQNAADFSTWQAMDEATFAVPKEGSSPKVRRNCSTGMVIRTMASGKPSVLGQPGTTGECFGV